MYASEPSATRASCERGKLGVLNVVAARGRGVRGVVRPPSSGSMKVRHDVRVLATPVEGVYVTTSASSQRFDLHWHDCYGFGLLDRGGQRWQSRCGSVEAYSG